MELNPQSKEHSVRRASTASLAIIFNEAGVNKKIRLLKAALPGLGRPAKAATERERETEILTTGKFDTQL